MPTRRRALLLGATAAVGAVGYRSRTHTHTELSDGSDVIERLDPTWRTTVDSPWNVRWEVDIEGRPDVAVETARGSVIVAGTRSGDRESPTWLSEIGSDGSVRVDRTVRDDPVNGPPSTVLPTGGGALLGGHDGDDAVRSTSQGYLIRGLVRRGERDDAPFVGTLGPDGDRGRWYLFDGSRSVWPLFASDQPLSVEETEDGSVIRAFGGV